VDAGRKHAGVVREPPLLFRFVVAAAAGLALLHLWLAFSRGAQPLLGEIPLFVPMVHGFLALTAFCIAIMALGRYRVRREPFDFWVGAATAGFSVQCAVYVLVWPGLRPSGEALIGHFGPGAPAWATIAAQIELAVLLAAAVLSRWPGATALRGKRWVGAAAAWVGFALASGALPAIHADRLPQLIGPGGVYSALELILNSLTLAGFACGAALSARQHRQTGEIVAACVALL